MIYVLSLLALVIYLSCGVAFSAWWVRRAPYADAGAVVFLWPLIAAMVAVLGPMAALGALARRLAGVAPDDGYDL